METGVVCNVTAEVYQPLGGTIPENNDDEAAAAESHPSIDPDELAEFQLETRLSDLKFSAIWYGMKELGWKYRANDGSYRAPADPDSSSPRRAGARSTAGAKGELFESAKDLADALDRCAMPEHAVGGAVAIDDERARWYRKMRNDILERYLWAVLKKPRKKPKQLIRQKSEGKGKRKQVANKDDGTSEVSQPPDGVILGEGDNEVTDNGPHIPSVGPDEIAAFQLRTRLSDLEFSALWFEMQGLGWTYRVADGTYQAPAPIVASPGGEEGSTTEGGPGERFESAKELAAVLDRCAMPKPGAEGTAVAIPDERARRHRKLRNDILERYLWAVLKKQEKLTHRRRLKSEGRGKRKLSQIAAPPNDTCTRTAKTCRREIRKMKTSNNTKSSVISAIKDKEENKPSEAWPDPKACVDSLRSIQWDEACGENDVSARHRAHFSDWRFLLSTNHSLLLYGFGSKRALLDRFGEEELSKEGDTLHIGAYDHSVTIDRLLDVLVDQLLGGLAYADRMRLKSEAFRGRSSGMDKITSVRAPPAAVQRAVEISIKIASTCSRPVYIVLHNIDGPGLRNQAAQEALSSLSAHSIINGIRMIRIAGSVDHINAAVVLWNKRISKDFAWVSTDKDQ